MSVILHFLWVIVFLGIWYGLGFLVDRTTAPFFSLLLRGARACFITLAICALLAVALAHSSFIVIPEDSRSFAFFVLLLGLSMIGIPVGFLAGIARAQQMKDEDSSS